MSKKQSTPHNDHSPWGNFFDLNGDGKTTLDEIWISEQIRRECMKGGYPSKRLDNPRRKKGDLTPAGTEGSADDGEQKPEASDWLKKEQEALDQGKMTPFSYGVMIAVLLVYILLMRACAFV